MACSWRIGHFALLILAGTWFAPAVVSGDEPTAPANLQALLAAGQVKLEFYDPAEVSRRYPGETRYNISFDHRFRIDYEPVLSGAKTVGATVRLSQITFTYKQAHTILLPLRIRGANQWEDALTRHELDHVAISADPRVELLIRELYQTASPLLLTLPAEEKLTMSWVESETNRLLKERTDSVLQAIADNYKLLDRVSQHGVEAIPERQAYFQRLYTKANLDEIKFPWTGKVLELLKSEKYQTSPSLSLP